MASFKRNVPVAASLMGFPLWSDKSIQKKVQIMHLLVVLTMGGENSFRYSAKADKTSF